jgi:hypothetical protein
MAFQSKEAVGRQKVSQFVMDVRIADRFIAAGTSIPDLPRD